MKSNLSIWHDVKTGVLGPKAALRHLEKLPGGGNDTQAYRRIKKFIGNKQKPKDEPEDKQ